MMKKANPTLEGQLLEYLESAPDDKSEVMWNVLQHLRARQRGETIENPTIEGRIAEYFETAPLEKAEVLFNIVELKLGRRMDREAAAEAEARKDPRDKSKRPHPEGKGRARLMAAPAAELEPTTESAPAEKASTAGRTPEARVKEPVIVPDEDLTAPEPSSPELDELPADLTLAEIDAPAIAEVDVA